jgi:hypothetical protein
MLKCWNGHSHSAWVSLEGLEEPAFAQIEAQMLEGGVTREDPGTDERDPGRTGTAIANAGPRRRDKAHLKFVASQTCLVCGRNPSDPHHLRFVQPACSTVSSATKTRFHCAAATIAMLIAWETKLRWKNVRIDPLAAALQFWSKTRVRTNPSQSAGDTEAGITAMERGSQSAASLCIHYQQARRRSVRSRMRVT